MRLRHPFRLKSRDVGPTLVSPTILCWGPVDWSLEADVTRWAPSWQVESDRRQFPNADIVIFHIPAIARIPAKLKGQLWVAVSMESDVNYPMLRDCELMSQFDYTMTYRRDSDFPLLYLWDGIGEALRRPAEPKDGDATAAYFASSAYNASGRTEYASELMRHTKVASYGMALSNRHLDRDDGWNTKMSVIAHYPFTLAFENSVSEDYVTEKFFQPLIAGSVPVYLGAPNVAEFAPGDRCFIDVNDFDGPADVAAYLDRLVSRPDEYAMYLAWKTQPFRQEFLGLLASQRPPPVERLCRELERRLASSRGKR